MSLDARLSALITAIGADIKTLTTANAARPTANQYNMSTSQVVHTGGSSLYLAGSNVPIPQGKVKVGTLYRCQFNAVKTAAGTAAPAISFKIGTGGVLADTSRIGFTMAIQTAVVDEGLFTVEVGFRVAGASAVVHGRCTCSHRGGGAGIAAQSWSLVTGTSAAFDVTGAGLIAGCSLDAGASSSWTISMVNAELNGLS